MSVHTESTATLAEATVEGQDASPLSLSQQVEQILQGGRQPPAVEVETPSPTAEPEAVEIRDLKTLAEKLRVDPAKLYDLKVTMPEGAEVSLGALKDSWQPAAELDKARKAFGEEQTRALSELEDAKREFTALLSSLDPRSLTPENLRMAQEQSEAWKARQSQGILKALPEWTDPVTRTADWADISVTAREYGFSDTDIAMGKAGLADYRLLHILRDLAKAKARDRAAAEKPKPKVAAKPVANKATGSGPQIGELKARIADRKLTQGQAADQLLKSYFGAK